MKLPIPAAALEQHLIALGKTGSGKSSKLRVLVEGLLEASDPVCIIDPKGDWWGLKSSADGKSQGFAIVIFGGEHGDVPLNPRAGAQVAELIATGNRPALVDLSGFTVGERTRFWIDFAASFFKHARGKRHLVIDEVHNFAPQGKVIDVDAGKALYWTNRLASEGRGKGITLFCASQRPAKVHKDLVTGCETLIACRVIHPLDRKAMKDWIDGAGDPAMGNEVLQTLAGMKRNEAWSWSPEIDYGPERKQWPMFWTYDSFEPQEVHHAKLKGWAEVDLAEVRAKLQTVVAEAEANDPKRLRARIAELERQTRVSIPVKAPVVTGEKLKEVEQRGAQRERQFLVSALHRWQKSLKGQIHQALDAALREVRLPPELGLEPGESRATEAPQPPQSHAAAAPAMARATPPRRQPAIAPRGNGSGAIDKAMPRAILTALAQHPDGLTKGQILVHTGYRSSGPVSTCFADLARAGWTQPANGGRLVITNAGLTALGPYDPLPIGGELRNFLLSGDKVSTMEKAMLRVLFEDYPEPIAKGKILERTGYASSGPVSSAFARLVSLGYAVPAERGSLRASKEFFA